jgi:Fe-S cluster biogenesis protein NfuA
MNVLRPRRRATAEIESDIRAVIIELRPMLGLEHCELTLNAFDSDVGAATLNVVGGCPDCGASAQTFLQGIEQRIKLRVAEVREVRCIVREVQHGVSSSGPTN